MKIVFGTEPISGWMRAAEHLGHQGVALTERVFDDLSGHQDLLVLPEGELSELVRRALYKYPTPLLQVPAQLPAVDCRPDFPGGTSRDYFACDVAVVGTYSPNYDPWLAELETLPLFTKVFGFGAWPTSRYCGYVPAGEVADAYRSARCVLDLEGCPSKVLAVWAAGGFPLSVRRFENTGILGLDKCPWVADDEVLSEAYWVAFEQNGTNAAEVRHNILLHHTFAARLRNLLA